MLLWVAWGLRISQYALLLGEVLRACLTDLSASVEGIEKVSLHTWLARCSPYKGRCSAVSQHVNPLFLLWVLFWKFIFKVLCWNTLKTSKYWTGSRTWCPSCETLHQKMSEKNLGWLYFNESTIEYMKLFEVIFVPHLFATSNGWCEMLDNEFYQECTSCALMQAY